MKNNLPSKVNNNFNMKQIFNKLLLSFENNKEGFSGRKLTAIVIVLNICYIHYKCLNSQNATEFLIVDLCGVLLLFGVITAQQVIELKNGSNTNGNTQPPQA